MRYMKKKIGLTALCLMLALSLIGAVDGGVASAGDAGSTSSTTVPPTTEVPAASTAPPTTVAPAPTTTQAPASRSTAARRGPDPRWIDYGDCGRGYTACHVAKAHQRDGNFQWRHGRWFRWGSERVRGTRGETWLNFQREARQVRAYLFALQVARHRQALVSDWSGVAHCESGGNWALASGNGYYGGLQFSLGTWSAYGGTGMPNEKPAWYQATIAERIRVRSGLDHWPGCGAYYG